MLGIAVWLQPDTAGRGTHRQLGLPSCTFVDLFQKPCPSCGMTTAWAHMVRGSWLSALRCNAGGAMLAITALVAAPWSLVGVARGRVAVPGDSLAIAWGIAIILVTLTQWMLRVFG
jgi:hypothetical protein